MITQTLEHAGRLTHDHNPTYTLALLGSWNDTNDNWHKTHFHSVFNAHTLTHANTHTHTHTHTYWQIREDAIIEYGLNTQAVND